MLTLSARSSGFLLHGNKKSVICLRHHLSHVSCTPLSDDQPYHTRSHLWLRIYHVDFSWPLLSQQVHVDITTLMSIGPLRRSQSTSVDARNRECYKRFRSRDFFKTISSVSRAHRFPVMQYSPVSWESSTSSSRLPNFRWIFHWSQKTSVSFTTPDVLPKSSQNLPNATISFSFSHTLFQKLFRTSRCHPYQLSMKWLSLLLLSSILTVSTSWAIQAKPGPIISRCDRLSHVTKKIIHQIHPYTFVHVHVTWRLSTFRCLKNENGISPLHNKLFSSEIHISVPSPKKRHISHPAIVQQRSHYQTNICFHLRTSFHTTSQHTTHARVIHTAKEWTRIAHTCVWQVVLFVNHAWDRKQCSRQWSLGTKQQ